MSNNLFLSDKLKITTSDVLGRHFIAQDVLKKGERLLTEQALVIGPHFVSCPSCLNCWTPVPPAPYTRFCRRCNIAPLCSRCYEKNETVPNADDNRKIIHDLQECDAFKNSKLTHKSLMDNLQIIMPYRCLLLNAQNFEHILTMEAHMEKRRNTSIWSLYRTTIIDPLYNFGLADPSKWNEETVQRVCGILDVNTFELRSPVVTLSSARALYPTASLMSHDCSPNVHVTLDMENKIRAFASYEILEGTTICCSYTNIMHPTWKRREHLREGKYFNCMCKRCRDATELGTNLQTVNCANCLTGQVIPMDPVSSDPWGPHSLWNCLSCNKKFQAASIKTTLDIIERNIAITDKNDDKSLEELLVHMKPILTPNHYLMLEVKETLAVCLRDKYSGIERPPLEPLKRKEQLCREIVEVLKVLEPGLSRLGGIAHYEWYVAYSQLTNVELSYQIISGEDFMARLKYANDLLRTSINLLIYEPENTPEGVLVKTAFQDLQLMKKAMATVDETFLPKVQKPRFSPHGRF